MDKVEQAPRPSRAWSGTPCAAPPSSADDSYAYSYDAAGSRLSKTEPGGSTMAHHNAMVARYPGPSG